MNPYGMEFAKQSLEGLSMLAKLTIFDHTSIPVAAKGLDAGTLRGKAIADNLANVTTPGFQRIEVNFEEQLRKALDKKQVAGDRTDPNHIRLGRPELDMLKPFAYRPEDPTKPGEVNNVDIDMEMSKLAENQLAYSFDARFIRSQLEKITSAGKVT
jgi:flagellar basal-body rod protein FlgB